MFFVQSHLRWIRISWNPIFQSRTLSGREINPLTSDSAGGEGATKGAGGALSHQHAGGGAHTQPTAVDRVLLVPLLAVFGDVGEADKPLPGLPVRLEGGVAL